MKSPDNSPGYQLSDLSGDYRFRILADHCSLLKILDKKLNIIRLMNPFDIVLKELFKNLSPEDILRLGFICGQGSIE